MLHSLTSVRLWFFLQCILCQLLQAVIRDWYETWVTIWVLWPLTHGYFSRGTALLWHNDAFTSTQARLWRGLYMTLPSERYEGISSLLFHRDFRFSQRKFFHLGTCTGVRMLSSCWCSCYMHPPDPLMVVWRTALDKDSGWVLPFPSPLLFPSMRTDFFSLERLKRVKW